MRRTLGITKEELLIGHVGQFRKEKNQTFLLDVLHSLRACGTKSKLLFVGDGESGQPYKTALPHSVLHHMCCF